MKIPPQLGKARLIPLKEYSKEAAVKWANNTTYTLRKNNTGYGVDAERSGLVIIDCDVTDEYNGLVTFMELCNREDDTDSLNTFTVSTPNGGYHFYYLLPENMTISSSASSVFGKGIDVRAKGGYAVGPGSKVKDRNGEMKEYEISNKDAQILPLPEWMYSYFEVKNAKNKDKKDSLKTTKKEEKESEQADEVIEQRLAHSWALSQMEKAQEGNRVNYLNKLAYFMGRKRVREDLAQELIPIAISKQLSPTEAEKTFAKAYQDGLNQERQEFEVIVKEFNAEMDISFSDDPNNTEFYSHFSLAKNFKDSISGHLFFWYGNTKWYSYDEETGVWEIVEEDYVREEVRRFLENFVKKIRKNYVNLSSNIYKIQERLFVKSTVDAISSVARTYCSRKDKDLFDQDPYLINLKNGVFNLKTKEMFDHSPQFFITKHIPIDYEENAKDRYCDLVLESINPEEREFLQVLAGQSLVGSQPISQAVFFFHGNGSNGKSTFIDLLLKTSGTYGKLMPPSVLIQDNSKENYVVSDFEGLRIAVIEELPESKTLSAGSLKRLAGTQKINSRQIYSRNREFENNCTVFVSCNKLPIVNETDNGTWRRLIVINFPYIYKKNKSDCFGPFEKVGDPMVLFSAQKNPSTAKAFLAWRIEGAIKWAKENTLEYRVPQTVSRASEDWRDSNDLIRGWFNDCVDFETNSFITILDLHSSYNQWAEERHQAKMSFRTFANLLRDHDIFLSNRFRIIYKKASYVVKDLKRSAFVPAGEYSNQPTPIKERPSYYTGLKFK